MKKLYFLIIALSVISGVNAQQSTFSKVFYDDNGNDQAFSMAKAIGNYYIMAGISDQNGLITEIDTGGNIIWSKKIGNDNTTSFTSVIPTNDSCFVLLGQCLNASHTASDIFYVKINSGGDTLWSKSIDLGNDLSPKSIQQTYDKGYIICGTLTPSSSTPNTIMLITKLDATGNISWLKKITCGNFQNQAFSVKQMPDSGYVLTGYLENHNGTIFDIRGCLIRLTSNGTVSWARNTTQSNVFGLDIIVTNDGLICLIGLNNGNGQVILKTDFTGNRLWSKHYANGFGPTANNQVTPKLFRTFDNGFVYQTSSQFSPGQLYKIDSAGNSVWTKFLYLISTDVAETRDSGLLIIGNGPIYGVKSFPTSNLQIGIIKTDTAGNSISSCIGNSGNAGTDTSSMNFTSVAFSTATGGQVNILHPVITDFGLTTIEGCVSFFGDIKENQIENTVLIYPNPATDDITVEIPDFSRDAAISIYNIQGKLIMQQQMSQVRSNVDISGLSQGLYMIKLITPEGIVTKKFIKD